MSLNEISVFAIILSVVANTVIGALWYSPILFANTWMKALGHDKENFDSSGANIGYMLTMLAAIVTAFVLSLFIGLIPDASIGQGALVGFLAGFGIAAARELSPTFFESRKMILFFISAGYHTVSLTVMGIIIAALS
ncbi:DUF1761 domain-containing protein [Bacillus timonensis]|nr:DUF1761 domain-containing protein [Bacillus timonensis]